MTLETFCDHLRWKILLGTTKTIYNKRDILDSQVPYFAVTSCCHSPKKLHKDGIIKFSLVLLAVEIAGYFPYIVGR